MVSSVPLTTIYFKASERLLRNLENGWKSYVERKTEATMWCESLSCVSETGVRSGLAFCLGLLIKKSYSALLNRTATLKCLNEIKCNNNTSQKIIIYISYCLMVFLWHCLDYEWFVTKWMCFHCAHMYEWTHIKQWVFHKINNVVNYKNERHFDNIVSHP